MELILWRHAEAEDGVPDSERHLTSRGVKQAKRMAEWLKPRITLGASIIVSPAVRTQQTAEALSRHYLTAPEIGVDASVRSVLKVVNWPHGDGTVIVVGHQPTLGKVAAYLLSGKEADWNIKKGAIWWITRRSDPGGGETMLRACMTPNLL